VTDYQPISCGAYSELELAIMHRERLRLTWVDGNVIHDEVLRPVDLQTRNHEEFLLCEDADGGELSIRLDRIRRVGSGS